MSKKERIEKYNYETNADLLAAVRKSLEKMEKDSNKRMEKIVAHHLAEMDRWWRKNYPMIPKYKRS